ncbi:MAG: peptidylprolyl isomerase [Bacteroidetes bacterium]|nr:peptidylprolyl isomerase [Bacteroidota bacterium]
MKIYILLLAGLFISCENKQSSSQQATTHEESSDKIEKTDSVTHAKPAFSTKSPVHKPIISRALDSAQAFLLAYGEKNPETRLLIESKYGEIEIELYKDTPLHRANFIFLAKRGYFDGTFFYRVARDFVVQAGNSDERATPLKRYDIGDYHLHNEFAAGHTHFRGAVSMARTYEDNPYKISDPYEFFIVIAKGGAHHLNKEHTVFGRVVRGLSVADRIAEVEVDSREWPFEDIPITVKVLR